MRLLLRLSSLLAAAPLLASAYITSPNAVPVNHQIKYLKQLTTKLVEAPEGELSDSQVATSHDLMYAWSHLPPTPRRKGARSRNNNNHHAGGGAATQYEADCDAALQVESLLKRLIDERRAGNLDAALTVDDYNCLLEGWARAALGEASAHRTEQILEAMQEHGRPRPNLASFKACLMAWRHSGVRYAAVRAQRILEWMIRLHDSGANPQALPDQDCFDMVLQIWSRSGDGQAPQKTEHLLGVMERLHRSTGLPQLRPRKTSFNAVLAAHSRARRPSVRRASEILQLMEALGEADARVAPDSASYNTVMNCYARAAAAGPPAEAARAAHQADAFLRHVVRVYRKQHDAAAQESDHVDNNDESATEQPPRIQPDTILFNTAMGLWAKTGRPGSFRRARSILDRQLDLAQICDTARPDVVGVTSVLGSCAAETKDRSRAWDVALATYRQLDKKGSSSSAMSHCRPNHVTYGTMIKACGRLLPAQARRKWLRVVFNDAVAAGSVGDMVVSKLREAATPDLYRELMRGHSRRKLPAAWTHRVREQSEYRTSTGKQQQQQQQQRHQQRNNNNNNNNKRQAKRAEV